MSISSFYQKVQTVVHILWLDSDSIPADIRVHVQIKVIVTVN